MVIRFCILKRKKIMNYPWIFQRFFKRLAENGKPLIKDFCFDLKEILCVPYWFSRDVCRFIKRVIEYSSILWKDKDYDYAYILDMIQYKIQRTREHIGHHNLLTNTQKYCNQMLEVEALIEFIRKDEFCEKEREAHDKKWGESVWNSIPCNDGNKFAGSEIRTVRLNVRTEKDRINERKEYRKLMNLEIQRSRNAWNRLFRLLNQNMRNWWD